MLTLLRYVGESIVIDFSQCPPGMLARDLSRIKIQVVNVRRGESAKIGTEAPTFVKVHRQEIMEAIDRGELPPHRPA